MSLPVVCVLGSLLVLLLVVTLRAGRVGETLLFANTPAHLLTPFLAAVHTLEVTSLVATNTLLITTRRAVAADTTRRPALVPDAATVSDDEGKSTRKTTLLTVLAIAVLTISTLLLYNVRSR